MKIPYGQIAPKQMVIDVANTWYDARLVKVDDEKIKSFNDSVSVSGGLWERPTSDFHDQAMFTFALNTINYMF